jgi:chromosome partitioning protein
MAHVIAVAALKGGVGKTTIALNVAMCLHTAGKRVLLVDADTQGSLRKWATRADAKGQDAPPVVGLDGSRLRKDLERVAKDFDVAIVDAPPQLGSETRAAMLSADVIVIPATPGATDVWALEDTLAVLDDARGLRPELEARLLLNRADRTTLASVARGALDRAAVPALESILHARVAYGEATAAGSGVVAYAPSSDAAREVRRLTKEVLGVLRGGKA